MTDVSRVVSLLVLCALPSAVPRADDDDGAFGGGGGDEYGCAGGFAEAEADGAEPSAAWAAHGSAAGAGCAGAPLGWMAAPATVSPVDVSYAKVRGRPHRAAPAGASAQASASRAPIRAAAWPHL